MTDMIASEPTPAQLRMATARAARTAKQEALKADMAETVSEDVVAQARAQRQAREEAERALQQRAVKEEAASKGIVAGPTRGEIAGMRAEHEAKDRERRAREAVNGRATEMVKVRILKAGDSRVSKGIHATGIGDAHYERGDTPSFPREIAEALEDRGFVEIEE